MESHELEKLDDCAGGFWYGMVSFSCTQYPTWLTGVSESFPLPTDQLPLRLLLRLTTLISAASCSCWNAALVACDSSGYVSARFDTDFNSAIHFSRGRRLVRMLRPLRP